ncbi:MAG: AraC family transcriptional regulator, partial [Oscillospiraceae bacterium]|nr:AraC family transcriptional regulator [Oscillospiraceae bacterium]
MPYRPITSVVDQQLTDDLANFQLSRELVSVGCYVNRETRKSILHSHPYYEYILVRKGTPEYLANGSRFSLHPDQMLLIPPGVPHLVYCGPDNAVYERLIVQIDAHFMEEALIAGGLPERISPDLPMQVLSADAVCRWNIHGLVEQMNLSGSVKDKKLRELLYRSQVAELMLIIEQINTEDQSAQPSSGSAQVSAVAAYLQEHCRDQDLTVALLARRFYVSREHLSRTFKEYTGESIRDYLTELRMQEFRFGLLKGKNILQSCMESGFSDYSSFVKSFRKLYGITPAEYREQLYSGMS